ncbi:hypothetical protein OAJ94_03520 [Deltaproteobacteria bacterium]|nr:hypothetical protein [Deltaproteobacteria bacterium]
MPWVDWTLLGVLAGGFAYGVATIAIRDRSLPFIIRQREESMDFSLHEEEEKEEVELTFTDARHEFNKILMELMEKREALLEKLRLKEEKEAAEEEAKAVKRKLMIMESIRDAAEKEALQQKKEAEEYAARKEKERVELETFKKRMETKRKEEEERLRLLEEEEDSARIADEEVRQENMLAMEAQRNFEVQSQSKTETETESEGSEADDKTQKELEQRLDREGAKAGEVQISLMWNDRNDLDLHVLCPSGERIHGGNRDSKCGGELDVDMNVRAESKRPVENVVWGERAPPGIYKAYVHFYKHHPKRRTKKHSRFTVIVNAGGEIKEYTDSLSLGDPIKHIAQFTMPELNQRVGYEAETSLERVKVDIANASTIEEYQEINLEGIPAGLKQVWEENIQRNIEDLEKLAEQEAKEARFEDVKQMLILATSPEELEDLDFTGFDENETLRLNEILESNIDVQQVMKYNELMEKITISSRTTEIQDIIISGVNEEQRATLQAAKDEALERFSASSYSEILALIDSASTSDELDEIELVGISEEQMKSLIEHMQGRFLELQNIESFDDIIRESDIDDENEISLTDDFKEVLSETLVGEENLEEAADMAKELHTVIEAETIEESITEESLRGAIEEPTTEEPLGEVLEESLQSEEDESNVESFDDLLRELGEESDTPEVETPEAELETPEAELDAPEAETPAVELETPEAELDAPEVELETPEAELDTPEAETPEAELDTPEAETPLERIKNEIANASTIEEYQEINLEGIPAGLKQVWKENIQRNIEDLEENQSSIVEPSTVPSEDETEKFDLLPIGSEMKLSSELLEELDKRLKYQGTERADWEVSLIWNNKNDLDLHLSTPAGNTINVDSQFSPCGGQLVAAMNSKSASKRPIEHLIWHSKPPTGTYEVSVDHFRKRFGFGTRDPTPFFVVLNKKGSLSGWEGKISSSEPIRSVFEFEIH